MIVNYRRRGGARIPRSGGWELRSQRTSLPSPLFFRNRPFDPTQQTRRPFIPRRFLAAKLSGRSSAYRASNLLYHPCGVPIVKTIFGSKYASFIVVVSSFSGLSFSLSPRACRLLFLCLASLLGLGSLALERHFEVPMLKPPRFMVETPTTPSREALPKAFRSKAEDGTPAVLGGR